ncbi:hypothetical protein CH380_16270 [Leptospira adleri]|uniref:Uncharacterized protein n=1 Tax=Leptospira adleri TaxID=2023186 RepID=A0A2M9YKZ1_9LEPT|nr:hypothetical protein CH380_16270 [Leptospira adleri]PJZ63195.1 hypothetical protein CH376_03970 [Leptospira adleri]
MGLLLFKKSDFKNQSILIYLPLIGEESIKRKSPGTPGFFTYKGKKNSPLTLRFAFDYASGFSRTRAIP